MKINTLFILIPLFLIVSACKPESSNEQIKAQPDIVEVATALAHGKNNS